MNISNEFQTHSQQIIANSCHQDSQSFIEPENENDVNTREQTSYQPPDFLYDIDLIYDEIRNKMHPDQYEIYRKILKK